MSTPPSQSVLNVPIIADFLPGIDHEPSGRLNVTVSGIRLFDSPETIPFPAGEICLIRSIPASELTPARKDSEGHAAQADARFTISRELTSLFHEISDKLPEKDLTTALQMLATGPLSQLISPEMHYLTPTAAHKLADVAAAVPLHVIAYSFHDPHDQNHITFSGVEGARCGGVLMHAPLTAIRQMQNVSGRQCAQESRRIVQIATLPPRSKFNILTRIDFEFGHALVSDPMTVLTRHATDRLLESMKHGPRELHPQSR